VSRDLLGAAFTGSWVQVDAATNGHDDANPRWPESGFAGLVGDVICELSNRGRVGAECAAVFVVTSASATPARSGWGRRAPPLAVLSPHQLPTRR